MTIVTELRYVMPGRVRSRPTPGVTGVCADVLGPKGSPSFTPRYLSNTPSCALAHRLECVRWFLEQAARGGRVCGHQVRSCVCSRT